MGGGKGQIEGYWGHILLKTPKVALISEYLAADLSADASADALCIIKIGQCSLDKCHFDSCLVLSRVNGEILLQRFFISDLLMAAVEKKHCPMSKFIHTD